MKKTLLTACLASLMFPACTREPEEKPRSRAPVPVPRVSVAKPVPQPLVTLVRVEPEAEPEAEPIAPVDLLALAHEHVSGDKHLVRSRALREEGELEGALLEARRSLADAPDDEESLSAVATLAKKAGEKALAAEAYARLAKVRPDDATPLIQQARLLLSLKKPEEAAQVAEEAIARDATHPEGYQALGRAHLIAHQLSSAIEQFEKVISLEPDHGYALNNLGLACLRANENARALEVLRRAADALPHVAYVHNNLGIALQRQGLEEEAREAFSQATSLSPKYVKARINLHRVALAESPQLPGVEAEE